MFLAQLILLILAVYVGVGFVIGVAFVARGVDHVDPAARGSGAVFRLLILPGCVALWPLIAQTWIARARRWEDSR